MVGIFYYGIAFVNAGTPLEAFSDNFTVEAKPLCNAKTEGYRTEVSDVGVSEFTNLGIFGTTETSIIYYADLTLSVKMNVFSIFDITGLDANNYVWFKDASASWLSVWWYEEYTNSESGVHGYADLAAKWKDFQFDYQPTQLNAVKLKMEYTPLTNRQLVFDNSSVTATIPKTECLFERVVAGTYNTGDVGTYSDVWENQQDEIKLTGSDISKTSAPSMNDAQNTFDGTINNLHIGVTTDSLTSPVIQQSAKNAMSSGAAIYTNTEDSLDVNLPMLLKPQIIKYNQRINVNYAALWVDVKTGVLLCATCSPAGVQVNYGPVMRTYDRCAGIHVDNYYISQEFLVKTKLFSTVELSIPVSEVDLSLPEVQMGDFV